MICEPEKEQLQNIHDKKQKTFTVHVQRSTIERARTKAFSESTFYRL